MGSQRRRRLKNYFSSKLAEDFGLVPVLIESVVVGKEREGARGCLQAGMPPPGTNFSEVGRNQLTFMKGKL